MSQSDEVLVSRVKTETRSFTTKAFDGQSFLLHSEEIVPSHEYRLALEAALAQRYSLHIAQEDADPRLMLIKFN